MRAKAHRVLGIESFDSRKVPEIPRDAIVTCRGLPAARALTTVLTSCCSTLSSSPLALFGPTYAHHDYSPIKISRHAPPGTL